MVRPLPALASLTSSMIVALLLAASTPAIADAPATAAPSSATDAELPDPAFQTVGEEVLVEMDDGVRIAATVARPSADGNAPLPGPFPVVLALTPYSRNGLCGCIPPDFFATRGMIGVVADVRGTGGSEGDLSGNYFSPREARDGAALVEHFGSMADSNGRVGMAGGSYVGITQYLTAAQQPRHLAAIVPMVPISDLYRDGYTHGGVPNLSFDLQYIGVQGAPGYLGTNTDPSLLEASLFAKLGQSLPGEIAFDYLARPDDDVFYRERSPIEVADRIEVPVLTIGSWHDGLLRGQTEMHAALSQRRGIETRLLMDPCTHKGCGVPFAPLTDPPGRADLEAVIYEFLARHLLDEETPARPAVELYVQGRDAYVAATQWPPAGVRYDRLHLGADGALSETSTDGTVDYVTNPAAGFSLAFNRYGTVAATPFLPLDQRLEGPQGVTFRTAAFDEPLTVVGPVKLHLVAASTATDTDWHAKLADVAPDGSETFITEGALRASHRALHPDRTTPERPYHTHTDPQPIEPGAFEAYEIEIWPTAYELRPGHQLQLRITSTDLPTHLPGWIRFDPERPQDLELHLHEPAINTVQLGASYLQVPVLAEIGDGGEVAAPAGPGAARQEEPGSQPASGTPQTPRDAVLPATGPALPLASGLALVALLFTSLVPRAGSRRGPRPARDARRS